MYLVTTVQKIIAGGTRFVFSDGHGLANFTQWFDDLAHLDAIDWNLVAARYWADKPEDNDRQRRKQAGFLAWQSLDWVTIVEIGVLQQAAKAKVEGILADFPSLYHPPVIVQTGWYY